MALAESPAEDRGFGRWSISSDSSTVVYLAETNGRRLYELFAVPITGGVSRRLNAPLPPGGSVFQFGLTPDGSRVNYVASQAVAGLYELFASDLVPDADGDGVLSFCECDDHDAAARPGAVDLPGDPVDQDCDGVAACDPSASYANHGAFVLCVSRVAGQLEAAGRITAAERSALVRDASRSAVGKR